VADRLADPGLPAHRIIISSSLLVRESTAPPRSAPVATVELAARQRGRRRY
jgi:hypothetical protein